MTSRSRAALPATLLATLWSALLGLSFSALGCQAGARSNDAPRAVVGRLDLRSWSFERDGTAPLAGVWGFFWNELVDPANAFAGRPPGLMTIPGTWLSAEAPSTGTGIGFATHTLRVLLPPDAVGRELGMTVGELPSASRLFVDDVLVRANGRVGTRREEEVPSTRPGYLRITPRRPEMLIVLQMSNFFHYDGGPAQGMDLGPPEAEEMAIQRSARLDYMVMGCAGVFAIYCAFLFAARPTDRSHLFFALIAFLVAVRIAATNWHLADLVPTLTDGTQIRIDYLTDFLIPPLYCLFLRSLYPAEVGRWLAWLAMAYGAFGIACVFTLPVHLFTLLRTSVYVDGLLVMGVCLLLVGRAALRGREGARVLAISTFAILVVIGYDIAHREHLVLARQDLFPFGLVLVICSHGVILGSRLGRALKTSETLSGELLDFNRSLEQRVQERTAELDRLATTDPLTGLLNRRSLVQQAETECARAVRHRHSLAVLLLDVDHFKRINDTYGRDAGDRVLEALARLLRENFRAYDLLGRYGGEEFVVVLVMLPQTAESQSAGTAERLRDRIALMKVTLPSGEALAVTVSIGIALLAPGETFEQVLRRADEALYAAKLGGRDRVSLARS